MPELVNYIARRVGQCWDWETLHRLDGDRLVVDYRRTLDELGKLRGTLGVIFRKAQNKIQDPAKLKRVISDLIEKEQWMTLDVDVKGDAYEGLLAKNAEDVKSGAGQYFTPRALIQAIVEVMRPTAKMKVIDPACGTGGFLLAAYEQMKSSRLDPDEKKFLRDEALHGWEIVDGAARICAMNRCATSRWMTWRIFQLRRWSRRRSLKISRPRLTSSAR